MMGTNLKTLNTIFNHFISFFRECLQAQSHMRMRPLLCIEFVMYSCGDGGVLIATDVLCLIVIIKNKKKQK